MVDRAQNLPPWSAVGSFAARRPLAAGIVVLAVIVAGAAAWRALSSDGPGGSSNRTGDAGAIESPPGPAIGGAPPAGQRASGPGTCAFLSVDDVSRATGATPVELRQSVSPTGGPGCEWAVGAGGAPLQVEVVGGGGAAVAVPGDAVAVEGPWVSATWAPSSRTLTVDEGGGQVFLVRPSDEDAEGARRVAVDVALLVAARN